LILGTPAHIECWPQLIKVLVAGGGTYYLAKRQINADKKARHEEDMRRRRLKQSLDEEFSSTPSVQKKHHRKTQDHAASPSTQATQDPAPAARPVETGGPEDAVDKYLAKKPYRAPKGDRFS